MITQTPCQDLHTKYNPQPQHIRICLYGRPNVGKSMLINSITRSRLKVANYTGVTVKTTEVSTIRTFNDQRYILTFIDVPGFYSTVPITDDEKIAINFIKSQNYDILLNIIDGTAIRTNLITTIQTLLSLSPSKPTITAINFADEMSKFSISTDTNTLTQLLGIPCHLISANTHQGIDKLIDSIITTYISQTQPNNLKMIFSQPILTALQEIEDFIISHNIPVSTGITLRDFAIKLLFEDKHVHEFIFTTSYFAELSQYLTHIKKNLCSLLEVKNIQIIQNDEIYAFVNGLCTECVTGQIPLLKTVTDKIDNILINKILGLPIFLGLMWALFQLTFTLGQYPADLIEFSFAAFKNSTEGFIGNPILNSLIFDGILGGISSVLVFLPNIFIVFCGIAIFEKTGYIARVAFLLDGFFHHFGLHGKSFIPLITGLGCSIPAYMSTRILQNKSEKVITMVMIGFIPCSAKLSVFVLLCAALFGPEHAGNALFAIYILGVIIGLICAKLIKVLAFKNTDDELFAMEMPRYRMPNIKTVVFSSYLKVQSYLKNAATLIAGFSAFIWLLSYFPQGSFDNSFIAQIGKFLEPLFYPMHFDWRIIVSLLSGLAAKEVAISTLGVLYQSAGQDLTHVLHTQISLPCGIAFIVFMFFYLPCISASIMFLKEVNSRKYFIYLTIFTTTLAYLSSVIAYHVTAFFT